MEALNYCCIFIYRTVFVLDYFTDFLTQPFKMFLLFNRIEKSAVDFLREEYWFQFIRWLKIWIFKLIFFVKILRASAVKQSYIICIFINQTHSVYSLHFFHYLVDRTFNFSLTSLQHITNNTFIMFQAYKKS